MEKLRIEYCIICKRKIYSEELQEDIYMRQMCNSCKRYPQKIGICRTCGEIFISRNRLFAHLRAENHIFLNFYQK
jgi:hypothetical protein